jgi:sugar lactone lactonase YvrE
MVPGTLSIEAVWPAELDLGEGALWDAAEQRFLFVDIHGCAIHAWWPGSGRRQSWATPERIGWLVPCADGDGFVAGFQSGFARVWLEAQLRSQAMGSPHAGMPDVRLNDAKADCHGRIWAGSMNNRDPSRPDGQLTRLDPSGKFIVLERGLHIANGPAIAASGQWMLHTDTFLGSVYRYGLTPEGELRDKTLWRKFEAAEGWPDGMTMDSEGCVWVAFWGGACIRRFSAEGELLRQIDLPALQITNLAFGGAQGDLLLVTSARNGMNPEQLAQYPQSGSAFILRAGCSGPPPCSWGTPPAAN